MDMFMKKGELSQNKKCVKGVGKELDSVEMSEVFGGEKFIKY